MNTSKLQAFATDARRQLMNAVQARLDAALVPNSDARLTTRVRSIFCSVRSGRPVAA